MPRAAEHLLPDRQRSLVVRLGLGIAALGIAADARFDLAASEATFCFEDTVAFQMQLATRNDIVPLTQGDIAEREERLKAAEPALAPRFSEAAD